MSSTPRRRSEKEERRGCEPGRRIGSPPLHRERRCLRIHLAPQSSMCAEVGTGNREQMASAATATRTVREVWVRWSRPPHIHARQLGTHTPDAHDVRVEARRRQHAAPGPGAAQPCDSILTSTHRPRSSSPTKADK
ncbi:uncharacterized protein LOC123412988 [Hordeum vulgare subsp. vulgare]|uniref:uncharacterized protein LOC123412988 n=1 Tax=Hordeum vulgare subsp. vulgare TaxID=112509 RepID=UPI001D1A5477|nr:uncharacterized protein LOC123412988 [Hordeum vulgare subsp. vulgare]